MPAKRTTSKKTEPVAEPAPAEEPPAPEETPETALDETPDEDVLLNRAERRAKARGKGNRPDQPHGHGKVASGHGPSHTHRMWSNRRSGG
jgi:hypothetical protein